MTTYLQFNEAVGGPVPGNETEIKLQGQGKLPSPQQQRNVLIYGDKSSAGTGTVATVYGPLELDQVGTLAGAGSPVHCLAARVMNHTGEIGPAKSDVYILLVDEIVTGTAATQILTFATDATDQGTWIFSIGGHQFRVNVRTGDSVTVQALAFKAAYDAVTWDKKPPLTIGLAAGVATLTWATKGEDANTCGLETIQDAGVSTTAVWTDASMAGGAGVQTGAITASLAAMAGTEAAACVLTHWRDDATLEEIIDQVNTDANATNQIPRYLFWGQDDTVAAMVTDATGLDSDDSQRVVTSGLYGTETWNGEVAATVCAIANSETHLGRSVNGLKGSNLNAPSTSDKFTRTEMRTLLEGGVTPLYVHKGESEVGVARLVSNRNDFGVMDFAVIRIADYVRAAVNAELSTKLDRASIVDDGAYQPAVGHIVTPASVSAAIRVVLKKCEALGLITNVDDLWAAFVSERNGTELRQAAPNKAVDQLHNVMTRLDFLV